MDPLLDPAPHSSTSVITIRSMVFGAFFATVNSSANMYFNFRYSGGLSQYWVIIVSYFFFKRFSSIKRERYPSCLRWLSPVGGFSPQEHAIVTLCGTAAAFCQSLGLSGGLAPLTLYYGHTFSFPLVLLWTLIAGFFGIFVGLTFGQQLVIESKYPWPVSQMNAETIASFHGRLATKESSSTTEVLDGGDSAGEGEGEGEGEGDDQQQQLRFKEEEASRRTALRIFAICFIVILPWYVVANVWLKFLVTFPILCWTSSTRISQVLGEGYTGVGLPGLSLGPSIILGWNASIIALDTTIWLVVGSVLNFWILSPALYYSGNIAETGESDGLAVWPGGLNIYSQTGAPYTQVNKLCSFQNSTTCGNVTLQNRTQHCSWGFVRNSVNQTETNVCYGGKIHLSSTMWLTMIGISWTLIGSIIDAGIDIYCPTVGCHYEEDEEDEDDEEDEEEEDEADEDEDTETVEVDEENKHIDVLRNKNKRRSTSYDVRESVSSLRRRKVGRRMTRTRDTRNRTRGDSVVILQGVPHTASGQRSLLAEDFTHRSSTTKLFVSNYNPMTTEDTMTKNWGGYGTSSTSAAASTATTQKSTKNRRRAARTVWCGRVGQNEEGSIPGWLGPSGVAFLGLAFVLFVHFSDMRMPIWGTVLTVLFATVMSYGLGALMATTAQNMAMPSAMVLQLIFGFLLPYVGEPNVVAAALTNAIVAQSLTLLNDFKMAVLLDVSTRDMLVAQSWGTLVGVVWSALVYNLILDWNADGVIQLGKGMWANLGAEGSHLLAQLFGEYGLIRIFEDHPPFMWFSFACFIVGISAPFLRRAVSPKYRHYVPNTILIGLAQFPPANAFSIFSGLLFALFYQVYLKWHHVEFYQKYRFVSTSGMNSGVGIGGLILLLLQALRIGKTIDLGGPIGDGCLVPTNMPQY